MSDADHTPIHPRERAVFLAVLDVTDAQGRQRFLDDACAGDAVLRARVEALLEEEGQPSIVQPDPALREAFDYADETLVMETPVSARQRRWEPPSAEALDRAMEGYDIEALIGHGGMGAVYKGSQRSLERSVAIKILPPEVAEEQSFSERFRREALAMGKLHHPNIVTIFDFGQVNVPDIGEMNFIAMEFVNGTDLYHMIRGGQLDASQALNVMAQVCDALQYAHDQGYVHRDIKPANIFVREDGSVKVGDFGLAKLSNDHLEESAQLTAVGHVIGTPFYMAPESMVDGSIDHRADIYSLGVMLYEMLTGSVPKGVFSPPSQKVKIDVRLDEVVLKAMQEEPRLRYQQVSEIKQEVAHISSSEMPQPAPHQAPSKSRRRVAWGVAVLVLVSIGGYFWGNSFPSRNSETRAEKGLAGIFRCAGP